MTDWYIVALLFQGQWTPLAAFISYADCVRFCRFHLEKIDCVRRENYYIIEPFGFDPSR